MRRRADQSVLDKRNAFWLESLSDFDQRRCCVMIICAIKVPAAWVKFCSCPKSAAQALMTTHLIPYWPDSLMTMMVHVSCLF